MGTTRKQRGAVVVTGASSGIGQACALRLDELGFRVFAGVRKPSDGQALRRKASDRLGVVELDVTDGPSVAAAAAELADTTGAEGLAGLVNNAGLLVSGPLEFLPLDVVRRQFEVNTFGPLAVTQALLPLLRRGRGRIVMMGSIVGRVPVPFGGPYSGSKYALDALTAALRVELRPWGIPVCLVTPGYIATPLWEGAAHRLTELAAALPARAHELYDFEVWQRYGERQSKGGTPPAAVAAAVAHALTAARPKARYVIGADAKALELVRRLTPTDGVQDWLVARALGTPTIRRPGPPGPDGDGTAPTERSESPALRAQP